MEQSVTKKRRDNSGEDREEEKIYRKRSEPVNSQESEQVTVAKDFSCPLCFRLLFHTVSLRYDVILSR